MLQLYRGGHFFFVVVEETAVSRRKPRSCRLSLKMLSHNVNRVHFGMSGIRTQNLIGYFVGHTPDDSNQP